MCNITVRLDANAFIYYFCCHCQIRKQLNKSLWNGKPYCSVIVKVCQNGITLSQVTNICISEFRGKKIIKFTIFE